MNYMKASSFKDPTKDGGTIIARPNVFHFQNGKRSLRREMRVMRRGCGNASRDDVEHEANQNTRVSSYTREDGKPFTVYEK